MSSPVTIEIADAVTGLASTVWQREIAREQHLNKITSTSVTLFILIIFRFNVSFAGCDVTQLSVQFFFCFCFFGVRLFITYRWGALVKGPPGKILPRTPGWPYIQHSLCAGNCSLVKLLYYVCILENSNTNTLTGTFQILYIMFNELTQRGNVRVGWSRTHTQDFQKEEAFIMGKKQNCANNPQCVSPPCARFQFPCSD